MRIAGSGFRMARLAAAPVLVVALVLFATTSSAGATANFSPSDPRATAFGGNVTACSDVGFGSDTQLGSASDSNASDTNVAGTVTNSGQDLDVAITGTSVVIDAIVVKGGDGYNVYTNPSYLPPTLTSPQNYISPLNNGNQIPTISHWFVCYNTDPTGVPVGTIGIVGFTGVAGVAFGVVLWRSRRRRSVTHAS